MEGRRPAARRTALITGAGRGIGREIAIWLAKAGHPVGLTARSADQLEETAADIGGFGATAVAVPGDITDPRDVARIHAAVVSALGPVEILVNNAGYAGPLRPFLELDEQQWRTTLTTNVLGPVFCTQAVLPSMLERGRGHIVNVNSLQGSNPAGSPLSYGVSKAAVMRLTDGLAAQLDGTGVIVFDLSPGLVRTQMTAGREDLERLPDSAWLPPDAAAHQLVRLISGGYDELHGRFVRATDDLGALLERVRNDPDARRMRLASLPVAVAADSAGGTA